MATFSKTPPKSKITFRKTEKPLTDDELRSKNETAAKVIAEYDRKISGGGYMSADDLAAYKNATSEYIGTGNAMIKRSGKTNRAEWDQLVSGQNDRYNAIYNEYTKYPTKGDWDYAMASSKAAEEAYQASLAFDVGAGKKRLAEMQGIAYGDYAANKEVVMASAYDSANLPYSEQQLRAMEYETMALEDKYGFTDTADLRSKIDALQKQIADAETIQALSALEQSTMAIPDFNAKNSYVSTVDANGNYDVEYEMINHRSSGKDVTALADDWATYLDDYGETMNQAKEYEYLTKMSEDEVKVYNYLINTGDMEGAKEYLSLLEGSLYSRRNADQAQFWKDLADSAPILADVTSILMAPAKGTAYLGQLAQYAMTGQVNENAAYNDVLRYSSDIRAARGDTISKAWDKVLGENWGKVGNFGYQLGMSMGDFLLNAGVSGGNEAMALTLMGTGAAADTTIAAKNRGLDDGQALALGTIAGAAEVVSEKIGWDALFDSALRGKDKVTYLLKNVFSEGLEEPTSSIINTLADLAISGDQAELRVAAQNLIDQGMDPGKAWGQVFGEYALSLGTDAIGGMLSGAAMGGGSIGVNAIAENSAKQKQYTAKGQSIIDKGDVESLRAILADLPKDDNLSKLSDSVGKKASPASVGRLYSAVVSKVAEQTKADIKEALDKSRVNSKETGKIADILGKYSLGQDLTHGELKLLEIYSESEKIVSAYKSVISDPDSITNKRLTGLETALTKKAVEQAKEKRKAEAVALSDKLVLTTVGDNTEVSVDGGDPVDLADVDFGNSIQVADLYYAVSSAQGMTTDAANMILRNPKSVTTPGFVQEALQVYNAGRHNEQSIAEKLNPSVITAEEARALFEAGKDAAKNQAQEAEDNVYNVYQRAKGVLQKTGAKPKGKLRIAEDVDVDSFNNAQTYTRTLAAELAPMLSVDIVLYNGTDRLTFGYYKASEDAIYLNVNSRWNKNSMMLFTMSHELVHRAKLGSPKQYKAFADYLIAEYGKAGVSVEDLVNQQIAAAAAAGVSLTNDEAFEEVVCDAAQRMLSDTDAGKKLTEWGAKSKENASIVAKIKELLTELFDMLRKYFKHADSDSDAANAFRKLDKNVQNILADLFVDMSTTAAERLSTIKAAASTEQFARDFLKSRDISYNFAAAKTHKDSLASEYTKQATVTLDTLTQRYNKILDIWNRVSISLNSAFLNEWNAKVGTDQAFDVFKAQSGYKYNIELSTMCKKGVALFEAIDTIVRKEVMKELGTDVLGKNEKEILYDILKTSGFEIPCAICYVEQARQREGVIIDSFLNGKDTKLGWNSVLDAIENRMREAGSAFSFESVSRDIATDKYTAAKLNMDKKTQTAFFTALMEECNKEIARYNKAEKKNRPLIKAPTREGITAALKGNVPSNLKLFKVLAMNPSSRFRIDGDLLYSSATTRNLASAHQALYSLFNSQGGVSGYKTKQTPVVYWGDLLEKKWRPSDLRKGGGIRNQSNSDSQMYTLLDQAQMYVDLTAKGYYLQAYTKVISELKLLGLSNAKINASLIPKVAIYYNADGTVNYEKTQENAGLDENGNPIFDDFEGIDHTEAFMLLEDPNYSKSIGGVCIGYSDNHIWTLLDDPRIQLIIGFHDKTNNPDKRYRGARYAKNYNGLNEAKQLKADGKYETVHVSFSGFLNQAEKMFYFNKATETFEGTINHNGKEYNADDIPKLAADLYLEQYNVTDENGVRKTIPAYDAFKDHENYYKLLADFSLYDSQGHYAPHKKVAYNMPDTVPYLDENGNKQTMRTEDYIKAELEKELAVRDQLALALSDESADGIIPQFRAALKSSERVAAIEIGKDAKRKVSAQPATDSNGNKLSEGQQAYFKYSVVRNDSGNLLVMYHGTSRGGFTVFDVFGGNHGLFGTGSYFTESKAIAESYTKKGRGTNPQVYPVYLDIRNPMDMDAAANPEEWQKAFEDVDFPASGTNEDFYRAVEQYYEDEMYSRWEAAESIRESIQFGMEYDGITHMGGGRADPNGERHRVYIAFTEEQIKSVDNLNPTDDPDIHRKISAMASRKMLADAFEEMIQSEDERKLVDAYRQYLDATDDLEAPLVEVRQKIREKVKANAPKEEISALRKQAASMQAALDANDAALLSMEAAQPLRDLMDKASKAYAKQRVRAERQKANERTDRMLEKQKDRYDQRLREQREKYKEKLDAQKQRYQDMRTDASIRRKESELRGKIARFKKDLQSTLEGKKGKQFVPRSLFEAMVDVCELIDTDTDLYKKDGSVNKAQQRRDSARDRLRKLRDLYKDIETSDDEVYQGEYDQDVYNYLDQLEKIVDGKKLTDLNLLQLEELYRTLTGIKGVLMSARELIGWKKSADVHSVADAITNSQIAIFNKRKGKNRSLLSVFNDDVVQNQSLSPIRYVERMAGFDEDAALVRIMTDLEDGVRKKNKFIMESYKMFELSTKEEQQWFEDAQQASGKYYTDIYGRKFRVSLMQKMQAVLSYERELANKNLNHVMGGGFIFADIDLMAKGKMKEAVSKDYARHVKADDNLINNFMQEIRSDPDAVAYMNRARRFFNEKAKNALNEASMAVKHRIIATEDAYIPYATDQTDVVQEISAEYDVQKTINGYGILKDLKNGASQALYITGLNNIIDRHIEQVGTVYGLSVPTRNFNKIWNAKSENAYNKDSVKGVIQLVWGSKAEALIRQAVQDVQGPRTQTMPAWYNSLRGNVINSTFLLNLSVVTKQIGSLYAANSELYTARDPITMLANLVDTMAHYDKIAAEIDQHTATAWMRRQGLSDEELHTLITETRKTMVGKYVSKKLGKMNPAKWITAMDSAVAMALWKYCKEDVLSANPEYQKTMQRLESKKNLTNEETAELDVVWKAIAHHYDNVVENTQSMSDSLHRPEIQKSNNISSLLLATFKTDVYQTAGQLQIAIGKAIANPTPENKKALGKTLYAVGMSAIWGQMMTVAFSLLRYKLNRYKDEDDELTVTSVLGRVSLDLFGEILGYVLPIAGSELLDIAEAFKTGKISNMFDDIAFSSVNDLITCITGITSKLSSGKEVTVQQWKKLTGLSLSLLGIPASNIFRTWEAVQKYIKDWADGELDFDE